MIKKLTGLFLASALTATLVFGQTSSAGTPRTPPSPAAMAQKRVAFLTTLLSLTADQQQQATTIFTNAATANSTARASLKTAHQTLKTAVQNNDAATIEQTATAIGNVTAQTTATEAKADAGFYQILTADQKTKFSQFASQGHFGGRGPGAAGFHGGGF